MLTVFRRLVHRARLDASSSEDFSASVRALSEWTDRAEVDADEERDLSLECAEAAGLCRGSVDWTSGEAPAKMTTMLKLSSSTVLCFVQRAKGSAVMVVS